MGSPGLWAEALKRVAAIKLAEFTVMYHEELDRRESSKEEDEHVTTHVQTELEDGDLLEGAIIAKKRRIGFGLPDIGTPDRAGTEVQNYRR